MSNIKLPNCPLETASRQLMGVEALGRRSREFDLPTLEINKHEEQPQIPLESSAMGPIRKVMIFKDIKHTCFKSSEWLKSLS